MLLNSQSEIPGCYSIQDVKKIQFPAFPSNEATLHVYECLNTVPFLVKRVFTIDAHKECARGFHAHKQATQLLICLKGHCRITIDDGKSRQDIDLKDPSEGLLIPPTLWAEQTYQSNTILMVLTDRLYEEEDYIKDYQEYIEIRKI